MDTQMGIHGYFLELRWCSIRKLSHILVDFGDVLNDILKQTYVYSVVYMASHDPSKYQFSTPTYVALYATLITAYYM